MPRETLPAWLYYFPQPALAVHRDFRLQPSGTFSKLNGVDGRYVDSLRRFPGFENEYNISQVVTTNDSGPTTVNMTIGGGSGASFFEHFTMQKTIGSTSTITGFLILMNAGGTDYLVAVYYDGSSYKQEVVYTFPAPVAESDVLDVSVDHRNVYIVSESVSQCAWRDGTNIPWPNVEMSTDPPGAAGETPATTGGYLVRDATYAYAFRWVFPEQGLYSPLSDIAEFTTGSTTDTNIVSLGSMVPDDSTVGYSTNATTTNVSRAILQIFRTVADSHADRGALGKLYLEFEVEVADGGAGNWSTPTVEIGGTLSDDSIKYNPVIDPAEVQVFGPNPNAKRIEVYDNLMVQVSSPESANNKKDLDILRWGFSQYDRLNILPVENRRRPSDLNERIQDLVRAGPWLAAVYDNAILRMHRSGTRMAVETIHNRYGSVGRFGSIAVGTSLYLVSPVGILLADLGTGQVDVINGTQRFCDETDRWRGSLDSVHASYDSETGALIFLNPVKAEAILIWMNHGVITTLNDLPFTRLTEGADLEDGGIRKTFFLVEDHGTSGTIGQILSIDADRSVTQPSTIGVDKASSTLNVTAQATSTSTIIKVDAGDTLVDAMVGHKLRALTGTNENEVRTISAIDNTAKTITVSSAFTATPTAGTDRFAIGGIPFEVTTWPLSSNPNNPGVLDIMMEKSIIAMGAIMADLQGATDSVNQELKLDMYKRDPDTPTVTATIPLTVSASEGLTADNYGSPKVNGPLVVPGIRCYTAGLDFRLLGLLIHGSVKGSYHDRAQGA